jgi:serine protease Do
VTEVKPFSIAAMAGIKLGTVILQVNRKAVKNSAEFKQIIKESGAQKSVVLLILNEGYQRYVVLKWK